VLRIQGDSARDWVYDRAKLLDEADIGKHTAYN
jgi:hypothetical protein